MEVVFRRARFTMISSALYSCYAVSWRMFAKGLQSIEKNWLDLFQQSAFQDHALWHRFLMESLAYVP